MFAVLLIFGLFIHLQDYFYELNFVQIVVPQLCISNIFIKLTLIVYLLMCPASSDMLQFRMVRNVGVATLMANMGLVMKQTAVRDALEDMQSRTVVDMSVTLST